MDARILMIDASTSLIYASTSMIYASTSSMHQDDLCRINMIYANVLFVPMCVRVKNI